MYKFFVVPVGDSEQGEQELNRFLRGRRIITAHKELVRDGGSVYWAFCVEYIENGAPSGQQKGPEKARVDYKEVLGEADFALFTRLRDRRRELADAEAVPVYAVCTNEHLAEMARRKPKTLTGLREIDGFGEAKAGKYGAGFLDILAADHPVTTGQTT
ncbi:MAG TPA: HRDC domain-containing protein [Candidatus Hydrogenedentes bacterium]|nr:HRDC domain-containing protein [Candidatus Hydrogenedentota bacterium]